MLGRQSLNVSRVFKVEDLVKPLAGNIQYFARLLDALEARFRCVKVWVGRSVVLSGLRSKIPLLTPNKEHKHGCVVSVESNPKSLSANAQREFLARPLSPLRFVLAWKGAHERLQVLLKQFRQLLDRGLSILS